MEAGDTERYQCQQCDREFEVCLEPKIAEMDPGPKRTREKQNLRSGTVECCPFCKAEEIEVV